ncbi:uncharacterized protein LOC118762205 [Octopus sinensis]|uniref:Uncharacterized protein LOC118762205 n=1 Tax=Octopus sinensis TaxID=2607531 RepID=A0A7E6EPB9_9MOLL|nr:uncharacterized protein LOC118762205 [Octopus sinensis]
MAEAIEKTENGDYFAANLVISFLKSHFEWNVEVEKNVLPVSKFTKGVCQRLISRAIKILRQKIYNDMKNIRLQPLPTNLVRWNVSENSICKCGKIGTLNHILSNCSLALNRYTWRHNLVLKVIFNAIKSQIHLNNTEKKPLKVPTRDFVTFVRSGQRIRFKNKKLPVKDEK